MPNEPIRLLLVEDNEDDAILLTKILLDAGYVLTHERVETEGDFRKALERENWDVILADYSLPSFSAVRALEVVHELDLDHVPFVVVSGVVLDAEAIRLMEMGAHDYIIKGRYERLPPVVAREMRVARIRALERQAMRDLRTVVDALQIAHDVRAADLVGALELIVRALDLRDKETAGHSQRVTEMSVRLAGAMGKTDGDLERIRYGALLHDIGKMVVPDAILLKPAPLTDAEWVIMRQHPVYAYELLFPFVSLRSYLDIAHCHHEKWDGTGYPRGLKGEAIPMDARIFSVVDVWDAMRSHRVYRRAWPKKRVLAYIRSQSGKAFDPYVVKVFIKNIKSGALLV